MGSVGGCAVFLVSVALADACRGSDDGGRGRREGEKDATAGGFGNLGVILVLSV